MTQANANIPPAANRQTQAASPNRDQPHVDPDLSMLANDSGIQDESVDNTERQIREQVFQIDLAERINQQNGGMNPNIPLAQQLYRPNPMAQMMMRGMAAPQAQQRIDIYDPATIEQMRNRPLSEAGLFEWEIETIMTSKFERSKINTTDKGKLECTVCLLPFKDGDPIKTLQCLHCYHGKCIDDWLAKRSTCPTCNFNMRSIDFDQLMN